jgi:hypothetical protein
MATVTTAAKNDNCTVDQDDLFRNLSSTLSFATDRTSQCRPPGHNPPLFSWRPGFMYSPSHLILRLISSPEIPTRHSVTATHAHRHPSSTAPQVQTEEVGQGAHIRLLAPAMATTMATVYIRTQMGVVR